MSESIFIDGKSLDIIQLYKIAYAEEKSILLELTEESLQLMHASREFVFEIVSQGTPVYGINTGFGALSNKHIDEKDLAQLQLNLIRSHCTGVGDSFSRGVVRGIMLLRANCLASGHSGINPEIVQLLLSFIDHDIIPVVPQKGSVGASGDLAPLSHIALALIGEGDVSYHNKILNSKFVMQSLKLKPAILGPKDGLALINGTAVMAALGGLALYEAIQIMKLADLATAMTLEGVKGTISAYNPKISQLKPHPGQINSSANLNKLLANSEIINSHEECGKVQDPYSLRCVPQVHGACRQTLNHAKEIFEREFNSVTDNPLIFPATKEVISGGNFHGEALALCMDYLTMGLSEICSISERRIEKMMNPTFSDLPPFLIESSGLNSGLMIAHVTAAALASENKYLCHPASVDSIPTSTDKEDHVSMGVTSGRKLHEVLQNTKNCLAIEFLCNTQAIDFQRPLKSSPAIEAVHHRIRKHVPKIIQDRVLSKDIKNIVNLINSNELINAVEELIGELK